MCISAPHGTGLRKYVVWCLICGGISCLIGIMFLGVYFLVRSYTSTVGYFETVPTFVPATLLMLTGLCIISLARRRNRYSYLIKLSGACGLASALTCALVTVTTTVLHMSRLQALKECEYTKKTRTCTCYPIVTDPQQSDDGVDEVAVRFVFDSSDECTIVHSALYACLRAIFGLSVAGVLVAVFSCMLVYQLLSHERKKMYWEQLELRCRSLYAGPQPPPPQLAGTSNLIGTPRGGPCRCCEQCHSHRNVIPSAYPWDNDNRFWATPTPGGQPGNFYSPNPGGDETLMNRTMIGQQTAPVRNQRPGWSWPRLPWQRSDSQRFRQTPSSPDSQYGFSNVGAAGGGGNGGVMTAGPDTIPGGLSGPVTNANGYTIITGPPHYGVWGPPPPYSDPNSPARRGRYQFINSPHCTQIIDHNVVQQTSNMAVMDCHQHNSSTDSHSIEPYCAQQQTHRTVAPIAKRPNVFKSKENYENAPSDSDGPRDRFSSTLPIRKAKKRVEIGANSIGPNQPASRINVQNVFSGIQTQPNAEGCRDYHDANASDMIHKSKVMRMKVGVENSAFNSIEGRAAADGKMLEPTESEVYFADVSSCCNMSIKNSDNLYDETNQRRFDRFCAKDENEEYLIQRFGNRETSTRSRLPFPQMIPEDYEKPQMNIPMMAQRPPTLIPKDISRQSMCSADSGEKTDFTDLSPATPCAAYGPSSYTIQEKIENNFSTIPYSNASQHFVQKYRKSDFMETTTTTSSSSSFVSNATPYPPYPSAQDPPMTIEHHRRSTVQSSDMFLTPDGQYDMINEPPISSNQFDSNATSSNAMKHGYDHEVIFNTQPNHFHSKAKSPRNNMNITPIKRQNENSSGTNSGISTMNPHVGVGSTSCGESSSSSGVGGGGSCNNRRDVDCGIGKMSAQDCNKMCGKSIATDTEWSIDHSDRRL